MASTSMGQDNHDDDNGNSGQDTTLDTQVCKVWPTAKPKICDKCGESFPSMTKFFAHRGSCKKYKCPHPSGCDLRFLTERELKTHVVTHRVRFTCEQCETEPFHSQSQLENHKKSVHGVVIKCPHCPKTFCRVDIRNQHVKNKHNIETANKCACGATYVQKWQLERHEQDCIVSPIGGAKAVKRKYQDLVDNASSSGTKQDLDVAVLALTAFDTVREGAQKKLKQLNSSVCCDTCGTSFKDKESLKRHIRKKHSGSSGSFPTSV